MRAAPVITRLPFTRWVVTVPMLGRSRFNAAGNLVIPVTPLYGVARTPFTARLLAGRLSRRARATERGEG